MKAWTGRAVSPSGTTPRVTPATAVIRLRRAAGVMISASAPNRRSSAWACSSDSIGITAVTQPLRSGAVAVASTALITAEFSSSPRLCSSKVQQPHCTNPAAANPHTPTDLRQRPQVTAPLPDGKEKVRHSDPQLMTASEDRGGQHPARRAQIGANAGRSEARPTAGPAYGPSLGPIPGHHLAA